MLLLVPAFALSAQLSDKERHGKQIYLTGTSPAGHEITALMGGEGGVEVPAAALPCVNCHGADGSGVPEGGVEPSNLQWDALTKPYGVRHKSGREHPPYTPAFVKRAVTMGVDPAGQRLDATMPLYRLTHEDMDALVAYVQKLGLDRDPGVEEEVLRLGTVLPPAASGSVGEAVLAVLEARLAEVSEAGGLYGRRLELVVERPGAADLDPAAALARLLEEHEIFALVAPIIAGADEAFARLAAEHETPVLGPFALHPQSGFPVNRQVFYLYAGLADQGRALVEFVAAASREGGGEEPRTVIVHAADPEVAAAANALLAQAGKLGLTAPERRILTPDKLESEVTSLAEAAIDYVFLLVGAEAGEAFLAAAGRAGWAPRVLASGAQLGRAAFTSPASFEGRLFLAFPTLPGDVGRRGREAYQRLAKDHALPTAHRTAQYSALAAVELLIEGLEQAGREVSREKLIDALEGLYDHPTYLTPPLTFGPNRRVGARGAYVVEVERESGGIRPVSGWIELR